MLGAALLTACAPTPTQTPAPEPTRPQRCDAASARSLIGSHRGAVDFAAGADVRFVCTTCSATEDYRPNRLNIRFDEATGIIRSVDCG
ncbi:hemolysin [Brevundimonas sp. TWP2-3-2]|uniref:hemolysin n=1 Tax=unclassified Brevundimonas TaxID=2622653 RepID=UPI003CEB3E08